METDQGLVLRSLDYKDQQKIITLFTPTYGIISLIVKGMNRKKSHLLTLTSPFTQAEYHFKESRSDLHPFRDGTVINTHHHLRKNLAHIEAATAFARALLHSQLPGKPAPALYQLTLVYLKHLPQFKDPLPLVTSFLLKLLKHDGYLSLSTTCTHCDHLPAFFHQGEPYCQTHAPSYAIPLASFEWSIINTLTKARNIQALQEIKVPFQLQQKIETLFKEKM